MSDAQSPPDFDPVEPNTGEDFEPVDVFPDSDDFDLRPGADSCFKCSVCDTNCPVAEVDDEFPGPKFQGPEQWRLKQSDDDYEIDDSVMSCSNCMRCDNACPSGVPLSQMHNTARGEYVSEQMSKTSIEYWRNRILGNYRTSATIASKVPRLANWGMNFGPARWLMEKTLGVTSEREFPEFASTTFREWWTQRGGADASRRNAQQSRERMGLDRDADKKVAYFHGCYSNFNSPDVGKAMVNVYEHYGYEVVAPEQKCSGTPMFANGMLDDARRHAEVNVASMSDLVDQGYDAIASCTSCSMALRQEYPELFDIEGIEKVSSNTFEAVEYLRIHEDIKEDVQETEVSGELADEFAYHAPCHARNQGLERQSVELFRELDGAGIEDVGESCSGISGTYGWKAEKYEKLNDELGTDVDPAYVENPIPGDVYVHDTCADSTKMREATGWEPEIDFAEGIRRVCAQYT